MSKEDLENPGGLIGVIGAGTMGNGIAQVAARAGYEVVMHDVRDEFLVRGLKAIDKSLQRDVEKGATLRRGKQQSPGAFARRRFCSFKTQSWWSKQSQNLAVTEVFKTLDQYVAHSDSGVEHSSISIQNCRRNQTP